MTILQVQGGRVIDPSQSVDEVTDLWIRGDRILALGPRPDLEADETIDATGLIVCPGMIDMHVHLREPGREEDETIATGTAAAHAAGMTAVACMPNTEPALDSPDVLDMVRRKAEEAGHARVHPIGAISRGRDGRELVDMATLREHGAVAFTDDGSPVVDSDVMRRAMETAKDLDRAILSHSEDPALSRNGVMNEGEVSRALGVVGYPAVAEEVMIFREIALAELTGARIHILHISSAVGVELVRRGKERGVNVTGEACSHHFLLTDESLRGGDTNFKMSPPLRTQRDIEAILEGIKDGTIDVLATDHAPHSADKKARGLVDAPNGIIGLETFLPLCIKALIEPGLLTWSQMIEKMTINPAKVLTVDAGTLKPGATADVTLIDPEEEWTVEPEQFKSKSRNCPFAGWELNGRATGTILAGRFQPKD